MAGISSTSAWDMVYIRTWFGLNGTMIGDLWTHVQRQVQFLALNQEETGEKLVARLMAGRNFMSS